ncbi:MAG: lysoplasmalogenase [Clostridiales bacterium]|nr:lysoplasmalogenase [Clostridiales bacterium]
MKILFLVLTAVCSLTLLTILMFYNKKTYYEKDNKSLLIMKMTMSSMFVLAGLFSMLSTGHFTRFSVFMLIGACAHWVGDLILQTLHSSKGFVLGELAFFTGHIFYLVAFSTAIKTLYPEIGFFHDKVTFITFLVLFVLITILVIFKKGDYHHLFIPSYTYTLMGSFVASRAVSLGTKFMPISAIAVLLPIGALLFLLSDVTLGMVKFKLHKNYFSFHTVSTMSYFIGQLLIALSLIAIHT